jgi:hypothetical protein
MKLRVGFAAADITPAPGLPMGGYAARRDPAAGTLDRLACRAVVFTDGERPIVVVSLDLLCVGAEWADALRRRLADVAGTEPARVLVAATHTHAAPAAFPSRGPLAAPALVSYREAVANAAVGAVKRAADGAEPMTLCFGEVAVDGVAASRRDPSEALDRQVRVLVARRGDGSCGGVIASFGCHPTVLSADNLEYSRDLFGAAEDTAAAALRAPAMILNGAAADVSTRFTRSAQTAAEVQRLGALLGAALASAASRGEVMDTRALGGASRRVALRPRLLPSSEEATRRMEQAASELERAQSVGDGAGSLRLAMARLEGAAAQLAIVRSGGWEVLLGREPDVAEVQVLNLGPLRLLAAPGEVFSAVGRRLVQRRPAMLAGYANDYIGYLVPPESAGEGDYESLMSAVEPDSAAALESTLAEMAAHA